MKKIYLVLILFALFFSCKVEDAGSDTSVVSHTVTIDLNGGEGITELAPKVDDGQTLSLTNPTKTGFVFKGWSTSNKIDNLDFIAGTSKVTSDLKIYAMFVKLVTVTIDTNGGTPATITKQVEAGQTLTLNASEAPKKFIYSISGYKDGNNFDFILGTSIVNDNLHLTTQWAVDLNAIREVLSGGTTTGLKWVSGNIGAESYITFKKSTTNPLGLDYDIKITDAIESHSLVLEPSDDQQYLVKFNPAITYTAVFSRGDYLMQLSPTELTYHQTNNVDPFTLSKQ